MSETRSRLPKSIVLLGLTSLFTDFSSDMITPLLPAFLVGMLGARAATLGVIEGCAETVSAGLKLVSGWLSDRTHRRKPIVVLGYSIASIARPLVGLAALPWHVLVIRVGDRVGKGIRTSPRDALIADAAPPGEAGRAFGFHRAMDHAGAVIGPLAASLLLWLGLSMRHVFLWAFVPAAIAMACLLLVREPARSAPVAQAASSSGRLPRRLVVLLLIVGVFALAASSDAFVLLRAQQLGVPVWGIPLLAAALSVVKMSLSPIAGRWSDRIGRMPLVLAGWLAYSLSYVGLALAGSALTVIVIVLLYGTYHGLTEATERALVRDLAPAESRGRAYGAYNAVIAVSALPAGLLTGELWDHVSPEAALYTCAALAFVATLALLAWARGGASLARR